MLTGNSGSQACAAHDSEVGLSTRAGRERMCTHRYHPCGVCASLPSGCPYTQCQTPREVRYSLTWLPIFEAQEEIYMAYGRHAQLCGAHCPGRLHGFCWAARGLLSRIRTPIARLAFGGCIVSAGYFKDIRVVSSWQTDADILHLIY